ncbi:MAG: glycoside hydrolase [Mucilaginibacter sp.]|nr:glycoside hydrolase [Mucilaginibacter sp.]
MKLFLFRICPMLILSMASCSKKPAALPVFTPIVQPPKVYSFDTNVAWGDEFNTNGAPDPNNWGYDVGGGGWGNNELEYYTNSTNNASITNGILTITAKKESLNGMNYTSARLVSKTPDMLYGRVEVKAKLPAGTGTWPAIWMLPNDYVYGGWPKSGELDIMEMVGYNPNVVYFTIHTELYNGAIGTQKGGNLTIPTASTDFHLYRVDWTPDAIKGYYDNGLVFTYANDGKGSPSWPYDQKFHLLMNIAVGGNWGGIKGVDDTAFPTTMQVDYVHYYKMITN